MNSLFQIDPIKWVDDAITSAANGRGTYIEWIGTPGQEIELMLRAHGIRVWARKYDYDRQNCYGVHVRPRQAHWAAGLIEGYGGTVVVGPRVRPIRPRRTWNKPAPAQGLAGALVQAWGTPYRPPAARTPQRRQGWWGWLMDALRGEP